jgi:hypothetical protein
MVIFNSYVTNYQRVNTLVLLGPLKKKTGLRQISSRLVDDSPSGNPWIWIAAMFKEGGGSIQVWGI